MFKVEVITINLYGKIDASLPPVGRREKVGEKYAVVCMVCEGAVSDGMWVRLTHAARFADRAAAEELAGRVWAARRKASLTNPLGCLNLDHWRWEPSPTNAFGAMQAAPKAVVYDVN